MNPIPLVPLPIDPLLPGIVKELEKQVSAVVTAEPGAGKTTRVPPALLSAGFAKDKEIWVLQPRRIAAKLAAARVAGELGEEIGERVGYQFRFEKRLSPRTRLRYLTDGMLMPLAQSDPALSKVAAVVLDEFHERSLALDLGLGWLKKLQAGPRPDLRILVMSATLDAGPLSEYLSGCRVFNSLGKLFPVDIQYHPYPQERDLSLKVRSAVKQLTSGGTQGTILVFLPGQGEINRCKQALQKDSLEVCPLYGGLSMEEQQKALEPSKGTKVILSTNLAETSLTVQGVTAVVDSGLTRQSRVSPWSGLESLVTVPSSQASAAQRAGRAGRLQAGVCLRLYSKLDFDHRPAFDLPELQRSDLAKPILDLKSFGADSLESFPWFQKPSSSLLESSQALLQGMGAMGKDGKLTQLGARMAHMSLHPRLSKFLMEAEELSPKDTRTLRSACRLAALISGEKAESEDLLEELKRYKPSYESQRLEEQLAGLLKLDARKGPGNSGPIDTAVLAKSLLSAFPDRVALVRAGQSSATRHSAGSKRELLLCGGGTAVAGDSSLTRHHGLFVVIEAQETTHGTQAQVQARSLCPIEMDWLLDLFPQNLSEEQTLEWNEKSKRVEGFKRLKYFQLVLDEKPLAPGDFGPEAASLLLKEALSAGPQAYCDPEELEMLLNRARFVAGRAKDFPLITEENIKSTLKDLCQGCRSLEDLKEAGLVAALKAGLSPQDRSLFENLAPEHLTLPSGRKLILHYEEGKPPWGESRIQDFFGMKKGPAVAGGKVPVVLHLLSPAKRPVQVTSDLAGFWEKHYPQVRKELSRRYPRHKWPENPG